MQPGDATLKRLKLKHTYNTQQELSSRFLVSFDTVPNETTLSSHCYNRPYGIPQA